MTSINQAELQIPLKEEITDNQIQTSRSFTYYYTRKQRVQFQSSERAQVPKSFETLRLLNS